LVDANVGMFDKNVIVKSESNEMKDDEEEAKEDKKLQAPFFHAMQCAAQVYCDKIIASSSDMMGVVFYGTVCILLLFIIVVW
jgi:hypothetical protein